MYVRFPFQFGSVFLLRIVLLKLHSYAPYVCFSILFFISVVDVVFFHYFSIFFFSFPTILWAILRPFFSHCCNIERRLTSCVCDIILYAVVYIIHICFSCMSSFWLCTLFFIKFEITYYKTVYIPHVFLCTLNWFFVDHARVYERDKQKEKERESDMENECVDFIFGFCQPLNN